MQRLGTALPLQNLPPGQQVTSIRHAEASGYEGIWVPEVIGTDACTVLAAASQVTQRLRLGTGIVPLYTRPLGALELIQPPAAPGSRLLSMLG